MSGLQNRSRSKANREAIVVTSKEEDGMSRICSERHYSKPALYFIACLLALPPTSCRTLLDLKSAAECIANSVRLVDRGIRLSVRELSVLCIAYTARHGVSRGAPYASGARVESYPGQEATPTNRDRGSSSLVLTFSALH